MGKIGKMVGLGGLGRGRVRTQIPIRGDGMSKIFLLPRLPSLPVLRFSPQASQIPYKEMRNVQNFQGPQRLSPALQEIL